MRFLGGAAAFVLALGAFAAPASARDSYVSDGAGLFSAGTVTNLNQEIGDFAHQTGKEVVVVTVPSLDGATPQDAAEKVFAQQQVNGVLIFLAKAEKKDGIVGDTASKTFFPSGSFDNIRQAMRGYFRTGDFDQGITTGVGLILSGYRSHERTLTPQGTRAAVPTSSSSFGGGGMSLLWLILILIAGFLIIRAVFRALMGGGQRMMPPGYGTPGYGPQGGMPGYGGGGGGGSFFSGLLGGLGGAFIGNELFGHQNFGGGFGGTQAGLPGTDPGYQADQSGWQSDAGQADMGNSSFGDFGSSGGGFGDGGGFGGGDSGGGFGGGDSGGGW
jgi:uncharacterized membrane protein YgcG